MLVGVCGAIASPTEYGRSGIGFGKIAGRVLEGRWGDGAMGRLPDGEIAQWGYSPMGLSADGSMERIARAVKWGGAQRNGEVAEQNDHVVEPHYNMGLAKKKISPRKKKISPRKAKKNIAS